jgi:hypothetical protein
MENTIMQEVATLARLFAPFMAHSMSLTQYLKELTGLEGKSAKLLASFISVLGAGLIVLAQQVPSTQTYVSIYFFVTTAFAVPGGYDLIKQWTGNGTRG